MLFDKFFSKIYLKLTYEDYNREILSLPHSACWSVSVCNPDHIQNNATCRSKIHLSICKDQDFWPFLAWYLPDSNDSYRILTLFYFLSVAYNHLQISIRHASEYSFYFESGNGRLCTFLCHTYKFLVEKTLWNIFYCHRKMPESSRCYNAQGDDLHQREASSNYLLESCILISFFCALQVQRSLYL